ncbi:MAG: hypothetical protein NVS9B13_03960 [Candidatus Acidiferrum sp.]
MTPLRTTLRTFLPALGMAASLAFFGVIPATSAGSDDTPKDAIGSIDGAAISVSGPMTIDVASGQVKTILRSGSDVRVKSGSARIDLIEGGQIIICGPAHLSVLKSGGALTLALDTGTIHAHLNGEQALTVYTPQIQAKPIAIGDGAQDIFVGLDAAGAMCVRANRGAVRIEQQLTGQSIIVPQSGDVMLTNGQLEGLRNTPGRCACELAPVDPPQPQVSRLATEEEIRKNAAEMKPSAPVTTPIEKQEPIYQVFMPPLRFDASAKVQPEPDPRMIILVRRIRVRPTLIFQGRVEGESIVAQTTPPPHPTTSAAVQKIKPPNPQSESVINRVRTFFHRLWTRSS